MSGGVTSAAVASSPGLVRRALHGTGARFGLAIAVVFLALTLFAPLLAPVRSVRAGSVELPVATVRATLVRSRSVRPRHLEPHPLRHTYRPVGDRDGRRSGAAAGRFARAAGRLFRRTRGCTDHAHRGCAAGIPLSVAGADHRRGAGAKPDQFGDRDRHHLYTAICAADAWAGADGADSGFRGGGTGDRGRASARDAASRAAEQLHARAGAGHAAVRSGGGGDGGTVVPRSWCATAIARLGRAVGRRTRVFSDGVVGRDVPWISRSSSSWSGSICWATR